MFRTLFLVVLGVFSFSNPMHAKQVKLDIQSGANFVFPYQYLDQGDTLYMDFNNMASKWGGDRKVHYTCVFSHASDPVVSCDRLPGIALIKIESGIIQWIPNATATGTFEIEVNSWLKKETDQAKILVNVREPYSLQGLMAHFDAQFARMTGPALVGDGTWSDLTGNGNLSKMNRFAADSWRGDGSVASPYLLHFSPGSEIELPEALVEGDHAMQMWISSTTDGMADGVILDAARAGYSITQKGTTVELATGGAQSSSAASQAVGFWNMSDNSAVLADTSGNNHHLNVHGLILPSSEGPSHFPNSGTHFDGSSYAEISSEVFGPGERPWSVEAWVRTSPSSRSQTILSWYEGSSYYALFVSASGVPGFVMRDRFETTGVVIGSGRVDDSLWHHIAASYDRNSMSLFVDGVNVHRIPISLEVVYQPSPIRFMIGAFWFSYAADLFTGDIARVGVYERALSPSDVQSHMTGVRPCVSSELLIGWNMVSSKVLGGQAHLYLNDQFQCSQDTLQNPTGTLSLGSDTWTGSVGDIKFYNGSALDINRVTYDALRPRFK